MIPRVGSRRIRPMWIAALASATWVNRKDVARWSEFLRRAVLQRQTRPLSEWITEAKVRVAVSSDPVLRRDPTLKDVEVRDGVVTLLTSTAAWPDSGSHVQRLKRVKGIADVKSQTLVKP
ncbi:MAG: hypothetical protein M3P52_07770 [Actinomycetota bacterium]|nr:hypothetical protein [Actinomycetota bacterium]